MIRITCGSETIDFLPYHWQFDCDGIWGHVAFYVKKGIFEYGANNGFACRKNGEFEDSIYDIVRASCPCMENEEDIGIETVSGFLSRAACALFENLDRLKPSNIYRFNHYTGKLSKK